MRFLRDNIAIDGRSPSIRNIAIAFNISTSCAQRYLDELEAKGLITRIPKQARSVKLIDDDCPCEGYINKLIEAGALKRLT